MNRTRTLAGVALTATTLVGSLGLSALVAAPASADVPAGRYSLTTDVFGVKATGAAYIRGNKMILKVPTGDQALTLHKTRNGGFVDSGPTRYTFTHRGGKLYTGKAMFGPIQLGSTRLVQR